MLSILLSISISVILLIWIIRMKKENPFPRFTIVKLLIAGAIAGVISAIVTLIGALINLISQIGPDQIKAIQENAENAVKVIQQIVGTSNALTADRILLGFVRTFILIGLVEELFKYFGAKIVMRKEGVVYTWEDALFCFLIVALGFQLPEDVLYSSGSIVTAIMRALTPFHFTFDVFMGYFYGLGKIKGNKLYSIAAVFVPSFFHALFDFSLNLLRRDENFIGFTLAVYGLMFFLTIFSIYKIYKWHKDGTLNKPL